MTQFIEAEQQLMVNLLHGSELTLLPEDLSRGSHRVILEAAIALRSEGTTPDLVTIHNKLKDNNKLEDAGGVSYLTHLMDGLPTKNVESYEEIVRDYALRRRVRIHAQALLEEAEAGLTGEELLEKALREPLAFNSGRNRGDTFDMRSYIFEELDEIYAKREGRDAGLETPWTDLNRLTSGLQASDLIIVAGRPSMGKTAFATQIAMHAAEHSGPVFVGSLEMSRSSLCQRILASISKIDSNAMRSGHISEADFVKLTHAAQKIQRFYPILINDTARLSAAELRVLITKAYRKYGGLSCAVIDYLGLIDGDSQSDNRVREVGVATKLLRATAKELNIPVVLLCQLNRSCEMRDDKRPTLRDLRESGEIEQDADVVIMLYRDEYYCNACISGNECDNNHTNLAEVLIRKQRKGPVGWFELTWKPEFTTFYNNTKERWERSGDEGSLAIKKEIVVEDDEEASGSYSLPF